jgi:hypothetical protein
MSEFRRKADIGLDLRECPQLETFQKLRSVESQMRLPQGLFTGPVSRFHSLD